ncbi:MAG: hypothetical protein C4582_12325 [Desulfobacteraceae bacterium]|jgi:hypothetical protein|nr:MAG: hypothetical protein C4582_12325 [Desulfobacteraceae bacterium]
MTREELILSAQLLTPPALQSLEEFSQKREELASQVNQAMNARPDLEKLVGSDGKRMSEDNNRNFSLFMESLLTHFQPEVLVDTALWVFRAYRSHGFNTIYWPANLDTWMEALKQRLSMEAFIQIKPFYAWLITHIPIFVKLTDEVRAGTGQTVPIEPH